MKVLMFDYRLSEEEFFKQNTFPDLEFSFFKEPLTEKTKLPDKHFDETDVICVYNSSFLNSKILSKFRNLRTVVTRSAEFDHIDTEYCSQHRIAVFNVNQRNENAIAEYSLGLILMLIRGIRPALCDSKYNRLKPHNYEGKLLSDLTLGIIGCEKAGLRLAEISNFFKMKVLMSSQKTEQIQNYCNIVPFEDLIRNSDVIVLNAPYNAETCRILDEQQFAHMKDGVIIINTISIALMDINALYKYLKTGKIKGVGLDIFNQYLDKKDTTKKIFSKLLDMPNVILTPYISNNIGSSIEEVLRTTIYNIRDCSKGLHTVNRIC